MEHPAATSTEPVCPRYLGPLPQINTSLCYLVNCRPHLQASFLSLPTCQEQNNFGENSPLPHFSFSPLPATNKRRSGKISWVLSSGCAFCHTDRQVNTNTAHQVCQNIAWLKVIPPARSVHQWNSLPRDTVAKGKLSSGNNNSPFLEVWKKFGTFHLFFQEGSVR